MAPKRRQSVNDQESNSHIKPNIIPLSNSSHHRKHNIMTVKLYALTAAVMKQ